MWSALHNLVLLPWAVTRLSGLSVPPEVNGSFRRDLLQWNFVCIQNQEVVEGLVAKRVSLTALEEVDLGESSLKLAVRHRKGEKKALARQRMFDHSEEFGA